jgi:hypothetical protein
MQAAENFRSTFGFPSQSRREISSWKDNNESFWDMGPPVPLEAGDAGLPDFGAQCQTMLGIGPKVISSMVGMHVTQVAPTDCVWGLSECRWTIWL